MPTLWIIDDNAALLAGLKIALASGYDLLTFTDPAPCLVAFQDHLQRKPDIVLADYGMPGMTGLELLEVILKRRPEVRGYLYSSGLTGEIIEKAKRIGVAGWMGKPFEIGELKRMIKGKCGKRSRTEPMRTRNNRRQSRVG